MTLLERLYVQFVGAVVVLVGAGLILYAWRGDGTTVVYAVGGVMSVSGGLFNWLVRTRRLER